MWGEKDGKPFSGNSVVVDGYRIYNPDSGTMRRAGYEWIEPPAPEPPPKRYSKLKIIRTLGETWPTYRARLETAGLLDQFMAAEYLAEDDPAFAAFLENVPDEVKALLDECLREE